MSIDTHKQKNFCAGTSETQIETKRGQRMKLQQIFILMTIIVQLVV